MMFSARAACRTLPVLALAFILSACGRSQSTMPDFADLVAKVSPSVVNISAIGSDTDQDSAAQGSPGKNTPPWLRKYLKRHGQDQNDGSDDKGGDNGAYGDDQLQSLGSGFIWSPNGYIVTNEHVIDKARKVIVSLPDGRQLNAKVVGVDHRSDLALLKIKAKHLPAVKIGNIKQQRVGEWVLAIGSPFGFDHSVTAGIISALDRSLDTDQYVPFIQTDAAINPGNSGGPLFNMQGQVIGINSEIYSQSGGFIGLAFAVPINVAAKVVHQLETTGHVQRGWLGVVVQTVTRKLAASFRLKVPRGALVTRVLPNSPAAQSGLRAGDVILSFNSVPVRDSADLPPLVGNADPNQTVPLKLVRNGKVVLLKVQLGALGSDAKRADVAHVPSPPHSQRQPATPDLGLQVRAPTAAEKSSEDLTHGVVVTAVGPGPARDAGLQPGDVLLTFSGQKISSPQQFQTLLQRATPGTTVPVLVQRQNGPLFMALSIPVGR